MKKDKSSSKKIALITGASQGIGKGVAVYLASKGINLILTTHPVILPQKVKQP